MRPRRHGRAQTRRTPGRDASLSTKFTGPMPQKSPESRQLSTLGSEKAGFDFHCSCAGRRIIRGEAREETSLSDIAQPAARPDSEHALLRTTRCAAVDRMRRPPVATSGLLVGGVDPLLYPNLAYDNRRYHTQDNLCGAWNAEYANGVADAPSKSLSVDDWLPNWINFRLTRVAYSRSFTGVRRYER